MGKDRACSELGGTMKYLSTDGRVRDCTSNISKMRWYEYGRYIGVKQIKYWYKEYFSNIGDMLKAMSILFVATLLIPFTPIIYPFVWSHRIRKAKKEMKNC